MKNTPGRFSEDLLFHFTEQYSTLSHVSGTPSLVTTSARASGRDTLTVHIAIPLLHSSMDTLLPSGGQDRRECVTNKVLNGKGGRWEEEVPPMAAVRCDHAVVSNRHTVVVAGGAENEKEK